MPASLRFCDALRSAYAVAGDVSAAECVRLFAHYELLLRWNRVLNLTRIENLEQAVVRHYSESLFLADRLPEGPASAVDVGSGAGFPGIPIAVRRPELRLLLSESHQRKAVFLREATRDLTNVGVTDQRAEEIRGQGAVKQFGDTPGWHAEIADPKRSARRVPELFHGFQVTQSPSSESSGGVRAIIFDWVVSRAVRWEDVIRVRGGNYALLLGAEDAASARAYAGIEWQPPLVLPWGKRRVLLVGSRVPRVVGSHVPRGT